MNRIFMDHMDAAFHYSGLLGYNRRIRPSQQTIAAVRNHLETLHQGWLMMFREWARREPSDIEGFSIDDLCEECDSGRLLYYARRYQYWIQSFEDRLRW